VRHSLDPSRRARWHPDQPSTDAAVILPPGPPAQFPRVEGGWQPYRGRGRPRALAGLEDWLAERFRRHAGNADVVRQELAAEKSITLSLRTIERAVAPLRREFEVLARATLRFETPAQRRLEIIAKLAAVLECEPAKLLSAYCAPRRSARPEPRDRR
jgi:hypothetical protein